MPASTTISLPLCVALDRSCLTDKTSRVAIIKLGFAVVLHQYFDLAIFTYSDEDGEASRPSFASFREIQYVSELAATTPLCEGLCAGEASNGQASLLVEHPAPTPLKLANGLEARLICSTVEPQAPLPSLLTHTADVCLFVTTADEASVSANLIYNIDKVSEFVATGFVDAFAAAAQAISSLPPDTLVADLDICPETSRKTISKWNQHSTSIPDQLLHELVGRGFRHKPDATAIVSWDGEMSYSELDRQASTLAAYMMSDYGLEPGKKVALCFEKCTWAIVCMLAVLKTGAAYCCLDPSHPRARHDFIIQQLDVSLVLASTLYEPHLDGHRVLVPTLELVRQNLTYQPPNVQPSDVCMVAFTSGSTGNPKGIVHTHNSLVAGITSNAPRQNLDREGVSTYQWSSFTFDVSMTEIYAPLIYGGRICIPSDEERLNRVEESMNRMQVNWAYFTPSFARFFAQYSVPSLQTLLMGGEVVTCDDINAWVGRVDIIHSYGPAEYLSFFLADFKGPCPKTVPIGHAPNTYAWIVNPENPELLSPLGAIGEMLYEGPAMLKEYLGDPIKTKQALIDAPLWRRNLDSPAPSSKLYKSGDLVRYLPDGTMTYIGRKDTMAKVRGQRLEVEEVETAIRRILGGTSQVAVDVITPSGKDEAAVLVAFLCLKQATNDLAKLKSHLEAQLAKSLPEYMIPRVFLPMESFPYNASRKLDRKQLRQHGSSLTLDQLLQPCSPDVSNHTPVLTGPSAVTKTNGVPKQVSAHAASTSLLRGPWAKVLSVNVDDIADDDNFFQHGGNSLQAMALVAAARSSGLSITVAKVFQNPTFAALASTGTPLSYDTQEAIPPFSLLGDEKNKQSILAEAVAQCNIEADTDQLQDILPATPLQVGFIAGSQERTGAYMAQYSMDIPPQVSIAFFKAVWEQIIEEYSILRTRLIYSSQHKVFQVILNRKPEWCLADSLTDYLAKDRSQGMGYGDPLCRLAIIAPKKDAPGTPYVVMTMHHALYDRHTLDKLLSAANSLLQGRALAPPAPFAPFIQHLLAQDQVAQKQFWQTQFDGVSAEQFPWLPSSKYTPSADSTHQASIHMRPLQSAAITQATVIRAAWSLLVSHYTGSKDVVHGITLSGRGAPVASILDIVEPTITTVPVRVTISHEERISEWLNRLQKEWSEMMEYEQTGLSKIKSYGEACRDACSFQNLLVIQSSNETRQLSDQIHFDEVKDDLRYFNEYALMVVLTIEASTAKMTFSFDSNVVDAEQVARYAHHLEYLTDIICSAASNDRIIGDIYPAGLKDTVDLVAWSGSVPEHINVLLYDLIIDAFAISLDKKAIEAWDGDMTFEELQQKSAHLAQRLKTMGAGPDVVVALLFEKSLWGIVSILAVLQCGAAFLFLDPSHPVHRQQSILQTCEAGIALASSTYAEHVRELRLRQVLAVDRSLFDTDNPSLPEKVDSDTTPCNLAYLVTTSGTTGEPKVIQHTHASLASGLWNHSKKMGITSCTRTLQVSTYTFDLAIYEILGTLMNGGCVCVPNDTERLDDLAACTRHYQANWALITASFARLLREQSIPTLQTLNLCGEYVPLDDEKYWSTKLHAMNWYGATEVQGFTMGDLSNNSQRPGETGRQCGSTFWIVDSHTNQLLPIGARGEIALAGPGLARGYAKDPVKTARAFRPAPGWLPTAYKDRRIYMTGDRGQINSNGTLTVLGRLDTQIKLNGKRIEVEDIEANIKGALGPTDDVAVDLVEFESGGPRLVAFVTCAEEVELLNGESKQTSALASEDSTMGLLAKKIRANLMETLPVYMIPRVYIPLASLPITSNGKLDRSRLRKHAQGMSADTLVKYTVGSESKETAVVAPPSATATILRGVWAKVLCYAADDVADDDDFFEHGGDSLKAIGLVTAARLAGLSITLTKVLRNPTFGALASVGILISDDE